MQENLYVWYCCILGIIGNTLTCLLLTKRIYAIKNRINNRKRTPSGIFNKMVSISRAASASLSKSRHYSDYKQNLTIYLYFIAISIADLIVLLNWLASLLYIDMKIDRSMAFSATTAANMNTDDVLRNYYIKPLDKSVNVFNNSNHDVFISMRCIENPILAESKEDDEYDNSNRSMSLAYIYHYDQTHLSPLKETLSINEVYNMLKTNDTFDVFVPFATLLDAFDKNIQYTKMKLIDIQGICQVHYYLTMVSLYATLGYTLACLIERLFKMKHILNNEIFIEMYESRRGTTTNSFSSDYESNITDANAGASVHFNLNLNERKDTTMSLSSAIARKRESTLNINEEFELITDESIESPKRQSHATLESSKKSIDMVTPMTGRLIGRIENNSSDLVRQLFGKSSVVFIGLFILLINFHLMWIYGSQKTDEIEEFEQVVYFKFNNISDFSSLSSYSISPHFNNGTIRIKSWRRSCQIYSMINKLPLFVMTVDLLLLLLLSLFKIGSLIVLLCKFYKINIVLSSRLQSIHLIDYKTVATTSSSEAALVEMPQTKKWQNIGKIKKGSTSTKGSLKPSSQAETSSISTGRSNNKRSNLISTDKLSEPKSNEEINKETPKRKSTLMSTVIYTNEPSIKRETKDEYHESTLIAAINHVHPQQIQKKMSTQSKLSRMLNRSKSNRSTSVCVKRSIERKKRKYFITKCLIMISLFSAFFSLPSVFTRNVLMIVILANNSQHGAPNQQAQHCENTYHQQDYHAQVNQSSSLQQQSPVLSTTTVASLLNSTAFGDVDAAAAATGSCVSLEKILSDVCNIFDLLLLFVSSHKFFIFLFQCYLIRIPNINSLKQKLFSN
jgi:hypothetical protein